MAATLATISTLSFLAGGAHLPRNTLIASSSTSILHVPRAAPLRAFGGSLDDLSDAEIQGLLQHRGVEYNPSTDDREQMLDMLGASSPSESSMSATVLPRTEMQRVEVFERVSPAVAFIQTSVVAPDRSNRELSLGAGSGFLWDLEGHVITNYHVIAGGSGMPRLGGRSLRKRVMVSLQGLDQPVEATVVGTEPDKDLAVLKIDPAALGTGTAPLEVTSSAELRVGQSVLAIGNPFGLDYTLTQGIVSALGREVQGAGGRPIQGCIQHDAAINPGNSGGPLLDSSGRLLGINTMIYAPNGVGANVGIGFAVPSDVVRRVVMQILTYGNNARPSLGVSVLDDALRKEYARSLGRPLDGALVAEVVPGSPADTVGIEAIERRYGGVVLGDMIVEVDGKPITKNEQLIIALEESEPERPIHLTVMRGCDPNRVEKLTTTPVARNALR